MIIALLSQQLTAALLRHYRALQEEEVAEEDEGEIITDNTLQTRVEQLIAKILLI